MVTTWSQGCTNGAVHTWFIRLSDIYIKEARQMKEVILGKTASDDYTTKLQEYWIFFNISGYW